MKTIGYVRKYKNKQSVEAQTLMLQRKYGYNITIVEIYSPLRDVPSGYDLIVAAHGCIIRDYHDAFDASAPFLKSLRSRGIGYRLA